MVNRLEASSPSRPSPLKSPTFSSHEARPSPVMEEDLPLEELPLDLSSGGNNWLKLVNPSKLFNQQHLLPDEHEHHQTSQG